jgi:hypothetical protein
MHMGSASTMDRLRGSTMAGFWQWQKSAIGIGNRNRGEIPLQ